MNWDNITKDEKVKQLLIDREILEQGIRLLDEHALIKYELEILSIPVDSDILLPENFIYQKDLINELINMYEHPEDSNKAFKEVVISVAREKGYGNDRY